MAEASGEHAGAEPRRRNAAATRQALLDSACEVFVQHGYDNASTRTIAGLAGSDPRLIGRYFGSKEKLFTEVVERVYSGSMLMTPDVTHPIALDLLSGGEGHNLDAMLLTIRSASSPEAVTIMRTIIEQNFQATLADALPGRDALGRAALLMSVCAGVQLQRNILGNSALTGADEVERLVPYLKAALDAIARAPVGDAQAPTP